MPGKPFKLALLVSVGMHSAMLMPWAVLNFSPPQKPQTQIEVTYSTAPMPIKVEISKKQNKIVPAPKKKEVKAEKPPKKEIPPKKAEPIQETSAKDEPIAVKKVVQRKTIRVQSSPGMEGNVSYLSYSQSVREKIRRHLYGNYRNFMGEGELTITFVLYSNGALKNISVTKELGNPGRMLHQSCIRSLKEASPFKPFPKELTLNEIPFTITISFKKD